MDIYEFTQVLWRRKWLLTGGVVLLIAVVAAMSLDFSNGIGLKSNPKFTAQVQMAVVPKGFETLSQDLGNDSLAAPATLLSSLLTSPQAAVEIQQREGVPVLGLDVDTTGRDRFFWVTALSTTADGAVDAALGSFRWLERRLSQPVHMASVPTSTEAPRELLDEEGKFHGSVLLEFDHAIATDAEGLWLVTRTDAENDFAFRLADAADDGTAEYTSFLTPGAPFSIALEDATGSPLDSVRVELPPLPADEEQSYRLIIGLDRGLVRGTVVESDLDGKRTIEAPLLDGDRVHLAWEPTASSADRVVEEEASEVGLLLLTDQPVPVSIGGRRTPLLIVAMTTAGIVALVVLVVAVDSWIQERHRHHDTVPDDQQAPVAQPISLSSQDAASDSRGVGS